MDNENIVPEIGMGVTQVIGSDRSAWTIVDVSKSKKRIVVQRDHAKRVDNNGMSEAQQYEFTPNLNGEKVTLSLRKHGIWYEVGSKLIRGCGYRIGKRSEYRDPSF